MMKVYKTSASVLALIVGSFLLALFFNACEDRAYNNPYDEKVKIDSLAPHDLQVNHIGILEKQLTWNCDAENAESFIIDKKTDGENWREAFAEVNGETHQWTDTAIELSKTYQYRVKAKFDKKTTPEASVEIEANIPAPSNLQTEKISDVRYKVKWEYNLQGVQGFRIDRKKNDENWKIKYGEVAPSQTQFIDSNVFVNPEKNINVEYRVYAFYKEYESTKTSADTNAELPAPANLEITQNSINSVTLSWEDNSEGEEGFKIERKYEGENWQEIADVKTNNYEDTNFELNTRVYYRIKSYSLEYSSSYAENDFDATIPPPAYLEITENSLTSVTLSWEDYSEGEEGFKIERKYEGGDWQEIADVQNDNYEDTDFELNTQVYYRIQSYYQEYSSTYTEDNFDATIPASENLNIAFNSLSSVKLNWYYPYSGHDEFQIDRKKDNGSWNTGYQVVDASASSFTDDVDLSNHDYSYRLISTIDDYSSEAVEESITFLNMEMVSITGGTFDMGSNNGDNDEQPIHTVTLSDFSISKYEITNAQYVNFLNDINCNSDGTYNDDEYGNVKYIDMDDFECQINYSNGQFVTEYGVVNHPVIVVSWYGARAFAQWAGGRLPTEAEWEFAAWGGNQSQGYTYSGSDNLDEVGWYQGNSDGYTHEVGQKQPNELGIYDMSGNAYEWCHDWYDANYYSNSPENNPQGPSSGSKRVQRGSSCYYFANTCRVAYRQENSPVNMYFSSGFRIVAQSSQ